MLTQIEWWGGVIFVLGALTYRMVMGALEKKEGGIPWYRLMMHIFFVAPAIVLAGYFYPLERIELQYAYLAALGASLVVVAVMLVQEMTGDASEEEAEAKRQGAQDKAAKIAKPEGGGQEEGAQAEAEEEEPGWLMTIVGAIVLYSPVLVACGLGCTKAWPMVQRWM